MHRVVTMVSVGIDPAQMVAYKEEILQKLDIYNKADCQVNDGQNEGGDPTLGVNVDFNSASKANEFHDWLKQYITERQGQFKNARTRVHDCFHAANENKPCQLGDVWELIIDGAE